MGKNKVKKNPKQHTVSEALLVSVDQTPEEWEEERRYRERVIAEGNRITKLEKRKKFIKQSTNYIFNALQSSSPTLTNPHTLLRIYHAASIGLLLHTFQYQATSLENGVNFLHLTTHVLPIIQPYVTQEIHDVAFVTNLLHLLAEAIQAKLIRIDNVIHITQAILHARASISTIILAKEDDIDSHAASDLYYHKFDAKEENPDGKVSLWTLMRLLNAAMVFSLLYSNQDNLEFKFNSLNFNLLTSFITTLSPFDASIFTLVIDLTLNLIACQNNKTTDILPNTTSFLYLMNLIILTVSVFSSSLEPNPPVTRARSFNPMPNWISNAVNYAIHVFSGSQDRRINNSDQNVENQFSCNII